MRLPNTTCPYIFTGRRAIFRADTQVRPYVNHDEMNMIGHANECIALDIWTFDFQFRIPSENHSSRITQPHPAIHDFPEQTTPILGADGDEIRPGLRIAECLKVLIHSPFKNPKGKKQKKFKIEAYLFIRENLNFLQRRNNWEFFNGLIIVSAQPDEPAAMSGWIIFHVRPPHSMMAF